MNEFFNQFFCHQDESYSVIVEDDGRVGYAYLLKGQDIVGDVWLYNQAPTPDKVNWEDEDEMPFLNPSAFVNSERRMEPIKDLGDVKINWVLTEEGELESVEISIHQKLEARLAPNLKPGYSGLAKKDGPLAKVLT